MTSNLSETPQRGASKRLFFKWSEVSENDHSWGPTEFQSETKSPNPYDATFAALIK